MQENKKCFRSESSCMFYILGLIGAAVYNISQADGFWIGVLGFLKAIEQVGCGLTCNCKNIRLTTNPHGSCYTLGYSTMREVALWGMYMYLYPTTDMCLIRKRTKLFENFGLYTIPDTPNLRDELYVYTSSEVALLASKQERKQNDHNSNL